MCFGVRLCVCASVRAYARVHDSTFTCACVGVDREYGKHENSNDSFLKTVFIKYYDKGKIYLFHYFHQN